MKRTLFSTLAFIAILASTAGAAPQSLSQDQMATIAGAEGIQVQQQAPATDMAQTKEVTREFIRRNAVTEYPVERTDLVFDRHNTLELGKTSGKTISDLFAEGQPGRLPQFFIDEANRIARERDPNASQIPGW